MNFRIVARAVVTTLTLFSLLPGGLLQAQTGGGSPGGGGSTLTPISPMPDMLVLHRKLLITKHLTTSTTDAYADTLFRTALSAFDSADVSGVSLYDDVAQSSVSQIESGTQYDYILQGDNIFNGVMEASPSGLPVTETHSITLDDPATQNEPSLDWVYSAAHCLPPMDQTGWICGGVRFYDPAAHADKVEFFLFNNSTQVWDKVATVSVAAAGLAKSSVRSFEKDILVGANDDYIMDVATNVKGCKGRAKLTLVNGAATTIIQADTVFELWSVSQ